MYLAPSLLHCYVTGSVPLALLHHWLSPSGSVMSLVLSLLPCYVIGLVPIPPVILCHWISPFCPIMPLTQSLLPCYFTALSLLPCYVTCSVPLALSYDLLLRSASVLLVCENSKIECCHHSVVCHLIWPFRYNIFFHPNHSIFLSYTGKQLLWWGGIILDMAGVDTVSTMEKIAPFEVVEVRATLNFL